MDTRPNVHLVIVDPQNDFCDLPGAALPIPGADADMKRLAAFINRVGCKLKEIHVSLDSHHLIDIAHPAWWIDRNGQKPNPFAIISAADIEAGIWNPTNPLPQLVALLWIQRTGHQHSIILISLLRQQLRLQGFNECIVAPTTATTTSRAT